MMAGINQYDTTDDAVAKESADDIVSELRQVSGWSDGAWEAAINGAEIDGDAVKVASMKSLAASCAESYKAAIEAVEVQGSNWETCARQHLADARALEAEGGDASHADMAIEALDDYLAEEVCPS